MRLRQTFSFVCVLVLMVLAVSLAAEDAAVQSFAEWHLARMVPLQGPTNHVQGIDSDGRSVWVTSVDSAHRKGYLREFSITSGLRLREVEIQDRERFHPGGISADGEFLWMPAAEYRAHSTSVIQKRRKTTLALEMSFDVPDHIGCIAVTPDFVIGGNWDSRDFYVWNRSGKLIRKVPSTTGNAYQDMKFEDGMLIASGLLPDHSGAIDWLELPSFQLMRRVKVGNTDRKAPFTREGMSLRGNQLWLLPEDDPSRLFVFRVSPRTVCKPC
jgi:Family of unknown function (DUF6454)